LSLIKSISGIRGTIGGAVGENLTPIDIVESTAAFGFWLLQEGAAPKIVLGRDARISGEMVSGLVIQTLIGLGIDVIDLGLSTTPTVEMAVLDEKAGAGIIVTASHNPKHWNALKFLNHKGEFISKEAGENLLKLIEGGAITFAEVDQLGKHIPKEQTIEKHIEHILNLDWVKVEAIREHKYRVVVDCVNSTGAIAMPPLLEALGCEFVLLNAEVDGHFAHNPEPLPKHLGNLATAVVEHSADLGIAVDPDVDRLALVAEDGSFFGEEYTLVAVADYVLKSHPGNTVSNLSSSRALRDVTQKYGGTYTASAVGEVNVVAQMKAVNAVIGGEGNGGVIVPQLHYGRDALAGVALVLSHLATSGLSLSEIRKTYPDYQMVKDKIDLSPDIDLEAILAGMEEKFKDEDCNTIDGLKIDFENSWVHLRKSNTEPIIRIYAESTSMEEAKELVERIKSEIKRILN
jgi:phosphomannomutase